MPLKREDNFTERRQHLKKLSDQELRDRFWELTEKIVDPLIELARTHTSPSTERSVLIRMGFNSLDAKVIVNKIIEAELIGKGAGHVVLKLARKEDHNIKQTGQEIINGKYSKKDLQSLFAGGEVK